MSSKENMMFITLGNVMSVTEYWEWIKSHLDIEHARLEHLIKKGISYESKKEWASAVKALRKSHR